MTQASVVIATYNRTESVTRLVSQLAKQSVRDIEVIVVDDGSRQDPAPALRGLTVPFELIIHRQANTGAAMARHNGAMRAKGSVLLFIDDDMQVAEDLVAAHLEIHARDANAVILGQIRPDPTMRYELFERFHADVLDRFARSVLEHGKPIMGPNVYTGNVSMRRATYHRVGGFDASFPHSEDAELGVRLEKDGARFYLSKEAATIHSSDRDNLGAWRKRARQYGVCDARIAKKHPDVLHANPWRYLSELTPPVRPLLATACCVPRVGDALAATAIDVATTLDRLGVEKRALQLMTLAFGLEYMHGLRQHSGSLAGLAEDWLDYAQRRHAIQGDHRLPAALSRMHRAIREDHATLRRYTAKYGGNTGSVPRDAVVRIGFQLMVAIRVMQMFRDAGRERAAMVMSRFIRHIYGADVHWNADIAPGVQIVHGMGIAISPKARIGRNVILFQNVTLGESSGGAPDVGANVHIGPGATLLGPIVIGADSKIVAGTVVRESIPASSIVGGTEPPVRARSIHAAAEHAP